MQTIKTEILTVKTFASDVEKTQKLELVNVKIRSCKNPNIVVVVEAFVVPLICSPVSNQVIDIAKAKYSMLKDLELADERDGN